MRSADQSIPGPAAPATAKTQYNFELDGLRGTLALFVLASHATQHILPGIWAVMDTFFVMSGYLIGRQVLLYSRTSANFRRTFFTRRALRTLPVYLIFMAASVLLTGLLQWHGSADYHVGFWPGLVERLTFTQNLELYRTIIPGDWDFDNRTSLFAFGVTWSIAVEEQFYILAGLLMPLFLARSGKPGRGLTLFLLSTPLISLGLRAAGLHWWVLPARADGFALGVLLAVLRTHPEAIGEALGLRLDPPRVIRAAALLSTIGLVVVAARSMFVELPPMEHRQWGHGFSIATATTSVTVTCMALMSVVVIYLLERYAGHPALRPLRNSFLGYVARISYSLYLWQLLTMHAVYWITSHYFGMQQLPAYALGTLLTFAISHASNRFVEQPCLARARKLRYDRPDRKSGSHAPATPVALAAE